MTQNAVVASPINLRGAPLSQRSRIFESFGSLESGSTVTMLTEHDPRALPGRLEELWPGQMTCRYYRMGQGEWHVIVDRTTSVDTFLRGWLGRTAAFAGLDDAVIDALAEAATFRTATKCEEIVREGATDFLGIVCEGTVALLSGKGRRERALFEVFPLEVFCDVAYFDSGSTLGRYVVLSKTLTYVTVPYDQIRRIGNGHPRLIEALGSSVAQHVRSLAAALCSQASQPIIARVAAALLPYARPQAGLHPALAPLPNMTQTQIAASAGTVKEVAARAIGELEERGALRRERGHVKFLARETLLAVCDPP